MTSTNFNFVAPIYDRLKTLVFGAALDRASAHFLSEIPSNSKILVVGGGSGCILDVLDQLALPLEVDFVDSSERMIQKAKRRNFRHIRTTFQVCDILHHKGQGYDVILTPFVLDVFPKDALDQALAHLSGISLSHTIWIHTDFLKPKNHQFFYRIILQLMFLFFRICCAMKNKQLYDYRQLIEQSGFNLEKKHFYSRNRVGTFLFRKNKGRNV